MAGYSEDELIEQPAVALLGKLGWKMAACLLFAVMARNVRSLGERVDFPGSRPSYAS